MGIGGSCSPKSYEHEYQDKLRKITESVKSREQNKFKDFCNQKRNELIRFGIDNKILDIKEMIDSGTLETSAEMGYTGKRIDSFFGLVGQGELYFICVGVAKELPVYKGVKIVFCSDKSYNYHTLTLMW